MASETLSGGVTLHCQPMREGDTLVFPYEVRNGGPGDIYVFDALQRTDPDTRTLFADPAMAVVALAPDRFAHVLQGIAPLPARRLLVRVMPLAARLPAGASLQRRLALSVPLHETGPYHPDLPIRQYRQRDIEGIVLTVQYLPASAPGFSAIPVDYAPDLFRVAAADTVPAARSVSCRLPARGLTILERTDAFPRPD